MILNRSKYEVISYTGKEEFPVVGDITMQGKEFCSAEVIDTWITNVDEVERLREFLDIVEKKMQYNESCKNDIPTMATHTGSTTTDEALYQLMQNTANEDTKIGDVAIAMIRQRVKILEINDDNTAKVEIIPNVPLPDEARIVFCGVPLEYISEDEE